METIRYFESEGWTDGLPVIPPTEPFVAEMLRHTKRAPDEVLGQMEPLRGTVTVEKVAANAVMAGDRKSTRLNSSHIQKSRMPSSA